MTPTPELNKAMVAALAEMPPVPLDSKNPFLKNRYASLGSVIGVSKPVLAKYGLAMEQQPFDRDGRIGVRTIVRHISGECSESEIAIEATNEKGLSGAQVAGSIFTYLRRYAWSAICGLYADEDTDGNAPQSSSPASRSVPEPPRQQSSPKEEKPLKSMYSPKETEAEKKARIARLDAWLVRCKAQLILELAEKERVANEYAQKHGLCLPNETIADVEVGKLFPSVNMDGTVESNKEAVAKDFTTLSKAIEAFGSGGEPDTDDVNSPNSPWRAFPMPFGKQAGVKLADLEKNYLFGLWANYTVEMEYNGKPKRPQTIEKDRVFRKMLDRAGEHYEFVKKD